MGLTAKDTGGKNDFAKAPEGTHVARCYKIIDLGTQYNKRWEKHAHKVMLVWELPKELITSGDLAGMPHAVAQTYTMSLAEKANLRRDLEAWRGKKFTDEELAGFDLSKLIGQPCYLGVTHNESEGKTYINVTSIMRLPKEVECPEQINDSIMFDLDNFDQDLFDSFSEGLRNWIKESLEYQDMIRHKDGPPPIAYNEDMEPKIEQDDIPFF